MDDSATWATAYVGLGSNLGDRRAMLCAAVSALDERADIRVDTDTGIASLFETAPIGGAPDQPAYLNSAVRLQTTRTPLDLLEAALSIETSLGRTRQGRWEAREIDIDLLLYEDVVHNDERLTLPHPRLHERRFVLEPLAQIAGQVIHPIFNVTVASLALKCRVEASDQQVAEVAGPMWYGEAIRVPASETDH
jgi:2-amino-4-hydroxy-6-hydroxymethyldihydropteridine diphosphokinase